MKSQPLVSVIVPIYNVEKYLIECLDSIVRQTYKNLEIILVDDGSLDKSGDMCEEYAKKDDRIRVLHKENEGLNFARRSGFLESSGEFILFVDSDDMIRQDTIERLWGGAGAESVDFVIGGYERFSGDLPRLEAPALHTEAIALDKDEAIRGLLLGSGYKNVLMMTAWGKLFKRSVIEGLDWKASNYRSNEDEFMALQYYSNISSKVLLVPESFYMYRENPDSITRAIYKNSFEGRKLSKFDTIEMIYQEAMARLDDNYTTLIMVKFIYEFILSVHRQVVDDESMRAAVDAYKKYFMPKTDLVNDRVLVKIDPQTRAQYEGLAKSGVVGCLQAKLKFIEQENRELNGYVDNLEKAIASKDASIKAKDKTINNQSRQIEKLENHPGVRAGKLYHRALNKLKKPS